VTRPVGVIGGSGNAELPGLADGRTRTVATAYGEVEVTEGLLAGVPVVHLSRHGRGHERLSALVRHKANLAALLACEVGCAVGLTACGAVDREVPLGSLLVFDDLHFPSNRLPDGSLCTWFAEPGDPRRAHWIFDRPFSEGLRAVLLTAAHAAGVPVVGSGCYGHVDGPRFNSRSEIAALRAAGVAAVSQTGGPEIVLAGEAELPYALLGFATDYANGVAAEPEPVDVLVARLAVSVEAFASVLARAVPQLAAVAPPGVVLRMAP
jgi:5'-methylthioadenosine phosphorylase